MQPQHPVTDHCGTHHDRETVLVMTPILRGGKLTGFADTCHSQRAIEQGLDLGPGRLLAPENAGWVGFDLVQRLLDRAGVEIVIAVPATVVVGPVQAPVMGADAVAQLGHAHLGPFGQVRVPRRAAVEDGDRAAANGCFDADLVAKASRDPRLAVPADPGDVGLWRCRHTTTLGP
jgi:hypothetical protein